MNCREEITKIAFVVVYTLLVAFATHYLWSQPRERVAVSNQTVKMQRVIDDTIQVCKDIIHERAESKKKWNAIDAETIGAKQKLEDYWAKIHHIEILE